MHRRMIICVRPPIPNSANASRNKRRKVSRTITSRESRTGIEFDVEQRICSSYEISACVCVVSDFPTAAVPPVEVLQFADEVIKINRKSKRQTRIVVITTRALYNFAPGSFKVPKRRIGIRELKGIILSKASDELVLQ